MSVSANVLGDVHVKVVGFKKFAKELTETVLGRNSDPVDAEITGQLVEFTAALQGRILEGGLKYGPSSWKHVDLMYELKQELYDVAGYSFLELLKQGEGIDPERRDSLMAMALEGFILWRVVDKLD